MKTLVNHGGVVQYKWIEKDENELRTYIETVALPITNQRVISMIRNQGSDPQFETLYQMFGVSGMLLGGKICQELYDSASKYIKKGKTIVFNEACGWTTWDDSCMKILEWDYLHDLKETVVLENGNELDEDVKQYLDKDDYLLLNNLVKYSLDEIFYYCNASNKIVFKTLATDLEQIESLLRFSHMLSSTEIVIINSPNFPSNDERLSHHTITIIE